MSKLKTKIKLSLIKKKAIELRVNYQIPYYLCYLIRNLNENDEVHYVHRLARLSEFYIRVKGYYKRYPLIEKEYNDLLKQEFEKRARKENL